ncbi:snurportin-1 isoform X2 [Achroia grisella]|uniref:snurportin-1 isoform X2 n=1 Tax=Achroia grisella TaxID=688607 RepID=UPI0027D20172|nr:snurportin-1 isoform X2 [Achroia grisella]
MDEVLERLETTLISEDEKNGTKTNFENLYKYSGRLGNQEERRKEILEIQKSNRNDKVDRFRGILELVNAVEEETIFKTSRVYYRPNIYVAGFNQTSPSYSNVLMLSEWLIEKPVDFNDNWYVTPCPKGIRMLVVAHQTEFRYFWLETKLAETPDLNMINKRNKVLFSLLPKVPCTPDLFNNFMNNYPAFPDNTPPIDGLLFYHKRAHYVAGETPLVGWLFPYMVQEVLGSEITVNIKYIIEKPLGYVKQADFIEKFEAKYQKKNTSRYFCRNSMDTSDSHHTQTKSLETNSNKNGAKETENMEAEENEIKEKKATTKCENMESDTVPINQVPEKKS